MLKFAYQGQPCPGGVRTSPHGPPDPGDKTSSIHSHSADGEDDSCCEVCHHRKRELSREKTRVNRARSRSRERIPRGYVSSSDTSTAFSEESRSRTDTSSEDASSLSCQNEERGRKISRPDLTQCSAGPQDGNKENERKSTNGKKGFILFKMFQKARMKEKKSVPQCPVCGNEESEGCCISTGSDVEPEWIGDGVKRQRSQGKMGPNSRGGNADYINAWRYNDGSLSSCETRSCYGSSKYFSCDEGSTSYKSRNRYRNNESDSECMVRRRKMQRTKSGSELSNLERNNNNLCPKGRPISRSCEKLQYMPTVIQESKENFGPHYEEVVLREDKSATDKIQKRYRKKNRRSKSCEKLNITTSPQKQSYRNYDSDWEVRSTIETIVVNQPMTSRQRRKALSCERLGSKAAETDDERRRREHPSKRDNAEQKHRGNVSPPSPKEEQTLVSRAPVRHAVKEATVRKTKTMRPRHSPPGGGAINRKPVTLPRQRSCQSDTEGARLSKKHSHEYNYNQNRCTDNDVTNRSRTLDRRLPKYSESTRSFDSDQSSRSSDADPSDGRYNSLPHRSTRCFQQSDDAIGYTAQLRQVASEQREQLFSPSNHGHDGPHGARTGEQQLDSRTRMRNLMDYALPENASIDSGELCYPSSSEDTHSLLETSIDSSSNAGLSIRHTRYTSLTSLSTTVSTTSEDSVDSGNGSLSDRGAGNAAGSASRYSPIEAERQRHPASGARPSRPPMVPQRSFPETSDYESETCSADLNSLQGRSGSPGLGQDSPRSGSPSAEVYRPPRIRYVL